jgi:hypothetical protein
MIIRAGHLIFLITAFSSTEGLENQLQSRPFLDRSYFRFVLHRRTRGAIEPRLHTKKVVVADNLASFIKADEVARPTQI